MEISRLAVVPGTNVLVLGLQVGERFLYGYSSYNTRLRKWWVGWMDACDVVLSKEGINHRDCFACWKPNAVFITNGISVVN